MGPGRDPGWGPSRTTIPHYKHPEITLAMKSAWVRVCAGRSLGFLLHDPLLDQFIQVSAIADAMWKRLVRGLLEPNISIKGLGIALPGAARWE